MVWYNPQTATQMMRTQTPAMDEQVTKGEFKYLGCVSNPFLIQYCSLYNAAVVVRPVIACKSEIIR